MKPGQRFNPAIFKNPAQPDSLRRYRGLSFAGKAIWVSIRYCDSERVGYANPSMETIARQIGKTTEWVRLKINELRDKGFIEIESKGHRVSNRYYFLWHECFNDEEYLRTPIESYILNTQGSLGINTQVPLGIRDDANTQVNPKQYPSKSQAIPNESVANTQVPLVLNNNEIIIKEKERTKDPSLALSSLNQKPSFEERTSLKSLYFNSEENTSLWKEKILESVPEGKREMIQENVEKLLNGFSHLKLQWWVPKIGTSPGKFLKYFDSMVAELESNELQERTKKGASSSEIERRAPGYEEWRKGLDDIPVTQGDEEEEESDSQGEEAEEMEEPKKYDPNDRVPIRSNWDGDSPTDKKMRELKERKLKEKNMGSEPGEGIFSDSDLGDDNMGKTQIEIEREEIGRRGQR